MLFLLNDVVLKLDARSLTPPLQAHRFSALSLNYVRDLGVELFAEDPMLHVEQPERARRLASLIASKAPQVNAALFLAPEPHCLHADVTVRLASVSMEVMGMLYTNQQNGLTNVFTADRQVWGRLAA